METTMLVALAAVALVVGLAIGWLLGQRAAGAGEIERAELRERLNAATAELGHTTIRADELGRRVGEAERERGAAESALAALTARHDTALDAYKRESAALHDLGERLRSDHQAALTERAGRHDALSAKLEEVEADRSRLASELNGLRSEAEANSRSFEREIAALKEAREAMKAEFSEVGGKLLATTRDEFLKRADERFAESEKTSGEKLSSLIKPMHDRLATYEEAVAKVERERQDSYGELKGVIGEMRVGQERVQAEAARLVNSLRNAPKARGRWGEQQLKNVLESCGLSEHVDFQTEVSMETADGRQRPDAIVRVPGGHSLVIDAKVSFNAYQNAFDATDEDERRVHLAAHAAAMRAHVNGLGNKAYQNQFEGVEFVVMFVAGEHFLTAALEHDPDLWDFAYGKRVLLATPTNLVAIARTVAGVWRQEKVAAEAKQIAALGKELFERIGVAADHLKSVGANLGKAVGSYNKLTSSFETRLLTTGRRFEELNVDTSGRTLPDLPPLEALPAHSEAAE